MPFVFVNKHILLGGVTLRFWYPVAFDATDILNIKQNWVEHFMTSCDQRSTMVFFEEREKHSLKFNNIVITTFIRTHKHMNVINLMIGFNAVILLNENITNKGSDFQISTMTCVCCRYSHRDMGRMDRGKLFHIMGVAYEQYAMFFMFGKDVKVDIPISSIRDMVGGTLLEGLDDMMLGLVLSKLELGDRCMMYDMEKNVVRWYDVGV